MNQLNKENYLKFRPRATWSGNDKLEGEYILTHGFASQSAVVCMYAPDSPLSPELSSLISIAAGWINRWGAYLPTLIQKYSISSSRNAAFA